MRILLLLLATTTIPSIVANAGMPDSAKRFEAHVFETASGESIPYRLLKPQDYDSDRLYPLVLFFHGYGESGSDNKQQLRHSVGVFGAAQKVHPCFVVVPQCPKKGPAERWGWADMHPRDLLMGKRPPKEMGKALSQTLELLRSLQREYPVDPNRLYVTGISMGGFGTWDLIARKPTMFAAAVPVCGGGDPRAAKELIRTPVWAFHGAEDRVVIPDFSRRTIEAMRKAGGSPKYTEFPGVGHNAWDPAFATPELLPWIFSQARRKSP